MNALITGASRGLGRAIAREFYHRGASLALVARSAAALEDLARELAPKAPQTILTIPADLADPAAPEATFRQLREKWDKLDALVNNAATTGPIGRVWENDWHDWQQTIQVNLLAPIALSRLAVPLMQSGAAIVNLAGGGATSARPNFTAYGTAKAALVRFTETLALEAAPLGIRVNAISPGILNTDMVDAVLRAGADRAGDEYARVLEVKRSGGEPPEKAAALAWFLASPESEGISGRLISAVWDPWTTLASRQDELSRSDIYTLRRIVPQDRGKEWK